ncbi:NAD(P)/FAD-dependent oxidoreductase [Candidatus Kaiserbacteria bacterium]|nr:NAD(P)/FAD-dependent oxidoreductase [Candidatus Kaiserbacteria bacterium]
MSAGKTKYDVIVIGGGASGMMAAGRAAERGKSVVLLEKNPAVGKKLDITGGGRCNITNAEFDRHAFAKHYGASEQFLYSPLSQFGVQDTFDFFTKRGLPLVVEARKRAFPESQKSPDVTRVMKKYLADAGVTVLTHSAVLGLTCIGNRITEVLTKKGVFAADAFVIATGGVSHPETGSTGDGFRWLAELGHTVHPPTPTIVPLKTAEKWVKSLAGISLAAMKITFFADGKRAFSKKGGLLFTHFGLSGPLILNSASAVAELFKEADVTATIDLYPDMDFAALEKLVITKIEANKNKDFKNVLADILPPGMAKAIPQLFTLSEAGVKAHSLTKEERKRLIHILKAAPLTITGLMGFDRAVISDGGVPLTEVDTRTMRSLKINNLYLTGDILHINRPSGGYSLQLCWTTGFVAGNSI